MAPKNKGKKGKKGAADDDDFWDKKEQEVDQAAAAAANGNGIEGSGSKNAFDMLDDDDEEDGGGLMGTINKASKAKQKKKKSKKNQFDFDDEDGINDDAPTPPPAADTKPNMDDEWPEDDVKPKKGKKGKKGSAKQAASAEDGAFDDAADTPPPATEVNMDDEWPEDDVKPKKGKKGKKGAAKPSADDEEEEETQTPEPTKAETPKEPEPAPTAEDDAPDGADDGEDDGAPKLLTKKEKEKLKKEKERAKKKAQAANKKTAAPAASAAQPTADAPAAAAAPAKETKGKKVPAHIAAMRAAMEEKARLEEEVRKAEEERQRKIEEEDARLAAEEEKLAAQKAAKKQKEKEKLARAKAEGKILTPAQKREKEIAEARKAAMLASGMTVAGLQNGGAERKKPVYGKKKGKAPAKEKEPAQAATPEPASPVVEQKVEERAAPAPAAKAAAADDDEDDWEKEDEAAVEEVVAGVDKLKVDEEEDDWDKSDSEPEPAVKVTEPKAPAKPAAAAKSTPAPAPSTKAPPKTNGKPAPAAAAEESSEEESSDEESDDEDDSETESESEDEIEVRKNNALARIRERKEKAEEAKSKDDLRSPIITVLGHVDSGKTRILDCIRQSSVQAGEAGGITQQIGATYLPKEALNAKTECVRKDGKEINIGMLALDTPGHASFSNLRSRGSNLCDIAILVIDILHGLEPTTLESIQLLRSSKTPFIVALNKIDRMFGWEAIPNAGFRDTFSKQSKSVKSEFDDRLRRVKLALSEQGFNSEIFDENTSLARNVSLVPTSAVTGEGIPDLLLLATKLTYERLNHRLQFSSELEATILDVKIIEGMGTTIDVIVSNGIMREGDRIILCGMDGPIVTNARALLSPQPLKELRIKSAYVHHKEVRAALGIKIYAPGLEKAIAGARLYVAKDGDPDEELVYRDLAMEDVNNLKRYATKGPGVYVSASTLGSLEALLVFLKDSKVPVRDFGIGPIRRPAVRRAAMMLEHASEFAMILAFDVVVEKEAAEIAAKEGVKIFRDDVIYHLLDAFTKHMGEVHEAKRQAALPNAVWPVRLNIISVFANRSPIVVGVSIIEGLLRVGTPIGVVRQNKDKGTREIVSLGKITSCEVNHKVVDKLRRGQEGGGAAIKIECAPHEPARMYGRHFDDKDELVSLISRTSLDTLKNNFRDQVQMEDWAILKKMKIEQGIP